jgi:hypothetical protein
MATKPWQTKSTNQLVPSRRAVSDARPGLHTPGAAEREKASRSVKVRARDELIAKHIYHPRGMFRFDDDGIATWPDDQFTARRLRDGDITLVEPRKKRAEEPSPKPIGQHAAVQPKPEPKPEPKPPSS